MGTAYNVLGDWMAGDDGKEKLLKSNKSLVLRWLNNAQNRHAEISGSLRCVWKPSLDSDGTAPLPEDFLFEFKDKVKWDDHKFLTQIDYATAKILNLSSTCHYSIYGGKFYVFSPTAGEREIPYVKRPTEISSPALKTDDLDTEIQHHDSIILYLDAMYARHKGDLVGSTQLLTLFKAKSEDDGLVYARRNDPVPMMRGGFF